LVDEGDEAGDSAPKPLSAISRRRDRTDIAVYREDDATFKNRLKENLVNHWLLNTIATLSIFVAVFYLITKELFIGLVAGLLVLIVSNLSNVMWKIRDFERWEIFSNGVKLGYDPMGRLTFIRFSDIRSLEIHRGLRGNIMVMDLGDRKLKYPYKENKDVFDLLQHKYDSFQEIQKVPMVKPP
jgi:hypothetical protein